MQLLLIINIMCDVVADFGLKTEVRPHVEMHYLSALSVIQEFSSRACVIIIKHDKL